MGLNDFYTHYLSSYGWIKKQVPKPRNLLTLIVKFCNQHHNLSYGKAEYIWLYFKIIVAKPSKKTNQKPQSNRLNESRKKRYFNFNS